MTKQMRGIVRSIPIFLTALLCIIFLWWRWRVGMIRYFDADEMAYLHWAHNVFVGRLPFVDFLSYVPPGFLYTLAPLFWLARGTSILLAGRVFAGVVFTGIVTSTVILFWQVRKTWVALLAGVFLAFMPIPADKFLEIRPDSLSMLLVILGMIFHIHAFSDDKKYRSWLLSGLSYSASLLILPKTLPQVAVALAITAVWFFCGERRSRGRSMWYFIFGLGMPIVVFGIWIAAVARNLGQFNTVVYSLTKLPLEVNRLGEIFPIMPYQFFYPNGLLYGGDGVGSGLIANHAIWLTGLIMGSVRLVTPFLPNGKKGAWAEVLIGGSMLAYVLTFTHGYPMRNEQYLIPVSVFAAFYAADFIHVLRLRLMRTVAGSILFAVTCITLLFVLFEVNIRVNEPKLALTNRSDYTILHDVITAVPKDSYVFDLVGSTIYYKDPYYVSGVPFGQWIPFLSRSLPSLSKALEVTQTHYMYEGKLGRLQGLPAADVSYITAHFHSVPVIPGMYER